MNRIPPSVLDDIRARLPASVVVGRRVKLKRAGRDWVGLCCFHAEKTGSLHVNDQRGRYHCFGCGEDGDIFAFLMRARGLEFGEAVAELAREAGVTLPQAEDRAASARRHGLLDVLAMAVDWYRGQLLGPAGEQARRYLAQRGIRGPVAERWRIGYAPPDRNALKEHLAGKGVGQEAMAEAGLIVTGDDVPVSFDRFRDRIMVPICDDRGRAVSFGGRALSPDAKAKYLNGPETAVFSKGAMLFNGGPAREAAHGGAPALLVEGYLDVVTAVEAGLTATVAPMGTALTDAQCRLLWRMSDEPVLCFDGDAAGRRAADRAIDTALPLLLPGRSLRIAMLPAGQDPDDLIRSRGREAMDRVISSAPSLGEALWRRAVDGSLTGTPEQRAGLEDRLRRQIEVVPDPALRRALMGDMRDRLRALTRRPGVYRSNGHSHHSTSPSSTRLAHAVQGGGLSLREALLVAAICASPEAAVSAMPDDVDMPACAAAVIAAVSSGDAAQTSALEAIARRTLAGAGITTVEPALLNSRAAWVI